jgi:hemerythrin-like domain-containing protein
VQPVGQLMIEHRLIDRMIKLIGDEAERIEKTGQVDPGFFDGAIDFMRTYADICHHGKEEHILFKNLGKKPLSDELRKTMDELVQEHVFARKTVGDLELAAECYRRGETDATVKIIAIMSTITQFYPQHIAKEDKHFFIPVTGYYTTEENDQMLREFADFDRQLIHDRYQRMIKEMEAGGKART